MGAREDLERAAQQQRDAGAKAAAGDPPAVRAKRERSRRAYRRAQVQEALGGTAGDRALYVGAGVGLVVPIVLVVFGFRHLGTGITTLIGTVLALVGTLGGAVVARGMISARHARTLRALGAAFDADAYRELLAENWRSARVQLRIAFASAWSDGDRATVIDAVKTWDPDVASIRWDGDVLALASDSLKTTDSIVHAGGMTRYFTNRCIHDWVARVVTAVAPKLAAITPIARISVAIDGSQAAWDDDVI